MFETCRSIETIDLTLFGLCLSCNRVPSFLSSLSRDLNTFPYLTEVSVVSCREYRLDLYLSPLNSHKIFSHPKNRYVKAQSTQVEKRA